MLFHLLHRTAEHLSDSESDTNDKFANIPSLTIYFGLLMALGNFIVALPQVFKLLRRRSPVGVSPSTLFIGAFGASFPLIASVLAHQRNWSPEAFNLPTLQFLGLHLLEILQGTLVVVYTSLTILWLRATAQALVSGRIPQIAEQGEKDAAYYRKLRNYVRLCLCLFALWLVANYFSWSYIFTRVGNESNAVKTAGAIYGLIGGACACGQWLPQLFETVRQRGRGSLSLTTISLHIPGCVLAGVTAFRSGSKISEISCYIVAALVETSICVSALAFERVGRGEALLNKELNA